MPLTGVLQFLYTVFILIPTFSSFCVIFVCEYLNTIVKLTIFITLNTCEVLNSINRVFKQREIIANETLCVAPTHFPFCFAF